MLRKTLVLTCLLFAPVLLAVEGESLKNWRQDIAVAREQLPRLHRDLFHDVDRVEFERMFNQLESDLPRLSDDEVVIRVNQIIVRMAGDRDGHTGVLLRPLFRLIPIDFFDYSDGVHVRGAAKPYESLAGARVVSLDGIPVADALTRLRTIAPGDNDMSRKATVSEFLRLPEALRVLSGREADPARPVESVAQRADGNTGSLFVTPIQTLKGLEWVDIRRASAPPLYLRHADPNPLRWYAPLKGLWFEYLEDRKALYVNYGSVADGPDETVAAFFAQVFAFADTHPVEKFIVDLRYNGGGNNFLNRPFLHGMIKRDTTIGRQGTFFVLIGRNTFSAAQNIVTQLEAHTDVTFAGEPTGGSPNHFGDASRLVLPSSGLTIRASTLWWQDAHPAEERLWIAPHIAVAQASSDDLAGRDPVLEAVLEWKPEPSLTERLRAALVAGKEEISAAYARWRNDPKRRYLSGEREVNALAVALYSEKKSEEALLLFEINAEVHPKSWRAQEAMGRAYQSANRNEEAIAAYRRALGLSDQAMWSRERLAQLAK